jgi:hypothetical protein
MPDDTWGATTGSGYSWFSLEGFTWPTDIRTTDLTIAALKPYVMNQQPAHVSALADQFVNAQTVLTELSNTIRAHSTRLYNETWTNSDARAGFMLQGPGKVLAYLKNWHEDLDRNVRALRTLVEPMRTSQSAMEQLWIDYEAEVAHESDPSNLSISERLAVRNPNWHDYINPLSPLDNNAQTDAYIMQQVQAVREKYNRLARELVHTVNNAYEDAFRTMRYGLGATYEPPNVLMVQPGMDIPHLPATPPVGLPGGVPTGPPALAPPAPPAVPPPPLTALVPPGPPVAPPAPPNAPVLPSGPPAVPTGPPVAPVAPGLAGGLPPLPPFAPGLGNVKLPGPPPGLGGGFAPGSLPGTAGLGATAPGFSSPMPPPGLGRGLNRGVLRNPGAPPNPGGGAPGSGMLPPPGAGQRRRRQAPGSTLRSPAANYTQTGTPGVPGGSGSGMLPPPPPGSRRRQPGGLPGSGIGSLDVPEAFNRGGMPPPVSPVLGRPAQRRQTDQPATPGGMRGSFAPPPAAPPVLNASTARPGGMTLPPGGIPPQRRDRRAAGTPGVGGPGSPLLPGGMPPGRGRSGDDRRRARPNLVGNPEWLAETGPDETASTAPVLRNQVTALDTGVQAGAMLPPQPGATSPVLGRPREAVRQAIAQNRTRPGRQATDAELELARRVIEADHLGRPVAETAQPAHEGEEAFTVQTPGGAVVGGAGPAQPEPAPRPMIGNS